jgi:hypothetical protein
MSSNSIQAIHVTMSDNKTYYLVGSLDKLITKINNNEKSFIILSDVFGDRIALNPYYIKNIRECKCVIITYYNNKDKSQSVSFYYIIGIDDEYTTINPGESYTGKGVFAKQIFVPSNSFE